MRKSRVAVSLWANVRMLLWRRQLICCLLCLVSSRPINHETLGLWRHSRLLIAPLSKCIWLINYFVPRCVLASFITSMLKKMKLSYNNWNLASSSPFQNTHSHICSLWYIFIALLINYRRVRVMARTRNMILYHSYMLFVIMSCSIMKPIACWVLVLWFQPKTGHVTYNQQRTSQRASLLHQQQECGCSRSVLPQVGASWRVTSESWWPVVGRESSSSTSSSGACCHSGESLSHWVIEWVSESSPTDWLCISQGSGSSSAEQQQHQQQDSWWERTSAAPGRATTPWHHHSTPWHHFIFFPPAAAAAAEEAERPPCWTHEEFVVTSECQQCTAYQTVGGAVVSARWCCGGQ